MSFMNTIRVANGFDAGQDRRPDLVSNCLHMLSAFKNISPIAYKELITGLGTIQFSKYYRTQ